MKMTAIDYVFAITIRVYKNDQAKFILMIDCRKKKYQAKLVISCDVFRVIISMIL